MSAVTEKEIPGRGLGLVAARDIAPGEVVLADQPILLYPQHSARDVVCRHCLRRLHSPGPFCSATCTAAAAADPGSHNQTVAAAELATDFKGLSDDAASALHLLIRASCLQAAASAGDGLAAARVAALGSLAAGPGRAEFAAPSLLARLPLGLHLEPAVAEALLAVDAANAYGVALAAHEAGGPLRGSALCSVASRLNHECLPNVARLDDFDGGCPTDEPRRNAVIAFKALHAIPAGEELTQSYFPLWWELEERQARCRELYGFTCDCPRCKVETMEESGAEVDPAVCGGADSGYVQMFLLKYLCPREECGGTLVPLAPDQADHAACNVCGLVRSDAEFLAQLEA